MSIHVPVTGTSNLLDCLLLLAAWVVIGSRIKSVASGPDVTVRRIRSYFGYFAIFNAFMALPLAFVYLNPSLFPAAMGWGYTIANVFLLISLSHLSRMAVKIVPQWADHERLVQIIWIVLNTALTILNIVFVALQNQPGYDPVTGVTQFHIPAFLGPVLGTISLAAYIPGIVLFSIGVVRERGSKRVRSSLLALGMVIIMVVGPLHAVAKTWQLFAMADLLNVVSLVLLASGVIYRLSASSTPPAPGQTPVAPAA